METRVELRRARLEMMLKVLDVDGAARRARRVTVDVGVSAEHVDQRGEILDLAFDRVRQGVRAVAASPPIEVDDVEGGREGDSQFG